MPRPPSKHGLEKKYKSWRRGKSKASTKTEGKTGKPKGSLRHVLRGKQRLLAKLGTPTADEQEDDDVIRRRNELETTILDIQNQIVQKEKQEKERQNAVKSHGVRFLERQRLTRMEKSTRKLLHASATGSTNEKETCNVELLRIALDQAYVAHFPHNEAKYIPLFRTSVRLVDTEKTAQKRAKIRQTILQKLGNYKIQRVDWISKQQYGRLPLEWNYEMEKKMFSVQKPNNKNKKGDTEKNDDRFALNSEHSAVLEVAEQLEAKVAKEIAGQQEKREKNEDKVCVSVGDSSDDSDSEDDSSASTSSSSDSVGDEADPLAKSKVPKKKVSVDNDDSSTSSSDNSSSSDSDDSSDDSSDEEEEREPKQADNKKRGSHKNGEEDDDDFDDFLMPVDETNQESSSTKHAFDNAKSQVQPWDPTSGDKSKGWATQNQRPDQRKRRRTQR
mmetsp:Transcript_12551/g.19433  ORF Transcript_12551/g.19433 Transcript_12551/m.19433 type:complete len:444 (-) Transcript_12551:152-1483(-)|eukprot:CAMPEP_0195287588 /NCGR_PEP_ID=MMETSP0707-20130614/4586_1 /TAXON_ID=33640 /ORGANISM="Asterionellopsis glacialis, Strain CCMP134" /LENGTH=443 /DNA_ID=CAMNT_0040347355 /DNA_START=73 /DNA_END=1404 /DNA_ORIENTATION=-